MNKNIALVLDDAAYRSSHGRPPRGRGSWAFCPADKYDSDDYLEYCLWSPYGTYADAVKFLRTELAKRRAAASSSRWVVCT